MGIIQIAHYGDDAIKTTRKENAHMTKELLTLRIKYGLSLNAIATLCGFDVKYVARMELGVPVDRYYAETLRQALAEHLGIPITEAELPIVLLGDEGGATTQIGEL